MVLMVIGIMASSQCAIAILWLWLCGAFEPVRVRKGPC